MQRTFYLKINQTHNKKHTHKNTNEKMNERKKFLNL